MDISLTPTPKRRRVREELPRENQQRGSIHVHILFWSPGMPVRLVTNVSQTSLGGNGSTTSAHSSFSSASPSPSLAFVDGVNDLAEEMVEVD